MKRSKRERKLRRAAARAARRLGPRCPRCSREHVVKIRHGGFWDGRFLCVDCLNRWRGAPGPARAFGGSRA
jgi:transposase-like protein